MLTVEYFTISLTKQIKVKTKLHFISPCIFIKYIYIYNLWDIYCPAPSSF